MPPEKNSPENTSSPTIARSAREARLAEQLRANLQRRKAQARSRRNGDADARPEGLTEKGVRPGAPPEKR